MMLPPRALAETGVEGLNRRPLGTGPFRFVEWVHDDRHIAVVHQMGAVAEVGHLDRDDLHTSLLGYPFEVKRHSRQ